MNFSNLTSTRSIGVYYCPVARSIQSPIFPSFSSVSPARESRLLDGAKSVISRGHVACSAAPESPTATVTESKEATAKETSAPAKPKRATPPKAPPKPLPQLMEEDVMPSLRTILEAQQDLSQIELSFQDNRLEGSFKKNGIPYYFWAFFPNGVLTGPKGFSLSSYGSSASTVEPFLIDEKKITAKLVVFWVEKRLAAQGILPVWKEQ